MVCPLPCVNFGRKAGKQESRKAGKQESRKAEKGRRFDRQIMNCLNSVSALLLPSPRSGRRAVATVALKTESAGQHGSVLRCLNIHNATAATARRPLRGRSDSESKGTISGAIAHFPVSCDGPKGAKTLHLTIISANGARHLSPAQVEGLPQAWVKAESNCALKGRCLLQIFVTRTCRVRSPSGRVYCL